MCVCMLMNMIMLNIFFCFFDQKFIDQKLNSKHIMLRCGTTDTRKLVPEYNLLENERKLNTAKTIFVKNEMETY